MGFSYSESAKSHKTYPCTKEIFLGIVRRPSVSQVCAEIADTTERELRGEMSREDLKTIVSGYKLRLPVFLFHATFSDGIRHNESAVPTGLSMLDLDHVNDARGMWKKWADRAKELSIYLAHITPSGSGLRLVFRLGNGETLEQGQKRMAQALGIDNYDDVCKDLARCSFAVPENYVLYLDDKLFDDFTPAPSPAPQSATAASTAPQSSTSSKSTSSTDSQSASSTGSKSQPSPDSTDAKETAATPQNIAIFRAAMQKTGLKEKNLEVLGKRHNNLMVILSTGITRLMPIDQMMAVVKLLMPNFYSQSDHNCVELIRDFYDKYTDPNKPMSKTLQDIYISTMDNKDDDDDDETDENLASDDDANDDNQDNTSRQKRIAAVMRRMPKALAVTVKMVPENMRLPVLCAVMPLAACYAYGTTVNYIDHIEQHLGLMSIIVGPQASGKSFCSKAVELWQRQMDERDERAREIEEQWKEKDSMRKADEAGVANPKVLIQGLPITVSNSQLLTRLKQCRGECLWSFGEELDTLRKTNSSGNWSAKYDVYRMGFDYGKWGQDYKSKESTSGVVRVCYNWSCLGTYGALRKCFGDDNIENGLSSRMIISEMPDASFQDIPMFCPPTEADRLVIESAVTKLSSAKGFLDTPRLRKAMKKWLDEKLRQSSLDDDKVMDIYRKRSAVIGFRCGVVAAILEGKESKSVLDFAVMMADYVCYEQCKLFGMILQKIIKENSVLMLTGKSCDGKSILASLPKQFSLADIAKRKGPDTNKTTLRTIISRWKKSGFIKKIDTNKWEKEV